MNTKGLDDQIYAALKNNRHAGMTSASDLTNIHLTVEDLFSKIQDIQTKAEQCDSMVQDICHDIRALDTAKRNLTQAIDALEKLQMYILAVHQLALLTRDRNFAEAASKLIVVHQLSEFFSKYPNLPRLNEITNQINAIENDLTRLISKSFSWITNGRATITSEIATGPPGPAFAASLPPFTHDLCQVAEAMGETMKSQVIAGFCDQMLAHYNALFQPPDGEGARLDMVEKRFKYFRILLQSFYRDFGETRSIVGEFEDIDPDIRSKIKVTTSPTTLDESLVTEGSESTNPLNNPLFPKTWHMDEQLCERFCIYTRTHLVQILEVEKETVDPEILLNVVKSSRSFEEEAISWFQKRYSQLAGDFITEPDASTPRKPRFDPSGAHARLLQRRDALRASAKSKAEAGSDGNTSAQPKDYTLGIMKPGIISSCFKPFLTLYIILEDKKLGSGYRSIVTAETWKYDPNSISPDLFTSATEFVKMVQESLNRCEQLTDDNTLLKIFSNHIKLFAAYATQLRNLANKTKAKNDSKPNPQKSKPSKIAENQVKRIAESRTQSVISGIDTAKAVAGKLFTAFGDNSGAGTGTSSASSSALSSETDNHIKPKVRNIDFIQLSMIVNTADYLSSLLSNLETRITRILKDSSRGSLDSEVQTQAFVDTLESTSSKFKGAISAAISSMIGELSNRISSIYSSTTSKHWNISGSVFVVDVSVFVKTYVRQILLSDIRPILLYLQKSYMYFFLNKLVRSVSMILLKNIQRIFTDLTDVGVQIWLMDLASIRDDLFKIPSIITAVRSRAAALEEESGSEPVESTRRKSIDYPPFESINMQKYRQLVVSQFKPSNSALKEKIVSGLSKN